MAGTPYQDGIPAVMDLGYLPEILTAAGVQRMFGKTKTTVMMNIYKGNLKPYRDGSIILIPTVDCVQLWGYPKGIKK